MAIDLLLKEETYALIGLCMEVHRELGHGFREIVYKDAIDRELSEKRIPFERERQNRISYKQAILRHSFFVDFVIDNKIILEVKAVEGGLKTQIFLKQLIT